jgi:FkbM family methyltransferase
VITDETLKHYRNKITYAQNREDLLLEAFFVDKKDGFYVDVGAYDPDVDSVTKLFYTKGWTGINVEPQPDQYARFVKRRSKDVNINAAIGAKKGTLPLRVYKSGGLSTLSDDVKKQYLNTPDLTTGEWKDITVKVVPLTEIFQKNKVQTIDFMKVDVEGFEMSVLESNDWEHYRPTVLCIEAGFSASDTRSYLKKKGYLQVFNDGLNDYYTDKRSGIRELPFIDHLLIRRGGGIRFEDYDNARKLYNHAKATEKKLDEALGREQELRTENARLDQTLNDKRALLRKSLKMYVKRSRK